jgi:hypothetical protein
MDTALLIDDRQDDVSNCRRPAWQGTGKRVATISKLGGLKATDAW